MNTHFGKLGLVMMSFLALLGMSRLYASRDLDAFKRSYEWSFQGKHYTMQYTFPWETYHFYQEKPRVFYNYAVYSYENPDYTFLPDFVRQLTCMAEEAKMDGPTTRGFVIAFVQNLDYQPEVGEYPKFPIETLAEHGGDCEDTSILLAAMLKELGYATVMVNPPGHMAVAIACKDCNGTAYKQNGQRFYYIETTATGFGIGQVPGDYATTTDKIYPMSVKTGDLWVLRSFIPKRTASGMVYFVSEDAGTQMAKSQRGHAMEATTTVKTVEVDGKVTTSKRISVNVK